MIKITGKIVFVKGENYEFIICEIQASANELINVGQAIEGERTYNGAELDFGGLIYPKNPIKSGIPLLAEYNKQLPYKP